MMQTRVAVMCVLSVFVWACSQQGTSVVFGTIERDRVSVRSTSAELIESVHVTEGSVVQQGELLVSLNSARQQLIVNQATVSANQAKFALEKLLNGARMEDLQIARAELDKAKAQSQEKVLEYRRIKTLKDKALGTQAELDLALASLQTAQASEKVAEQTLQKLIAGSRPEDVASAQAFLDAANAKVDLEIIKLNELRIVATRSGILDSLPFNVGDRVQENSVVAILLADTVPFVRVYLPEPNKAHLAVGSELRLSIDGMDESVTGRLRWLSAEPAFTPYNSMSEDDRSRLVYLAEIDLPERYKHLSAGIPVKVTLDSL